MRYNGLAWQADQRQPLLKRPDVDFHNISLRRAAQYGMVIATAAFWLTVVFCGRWY